MRVRVPVTLPLNGLKLNGPWNTADAPLETLDKWLELELAMAMEMERWRWTDAQMDGFESQTKEGNEGVPRSSNAIDVPRSQSQKAKKKKKKRKEKG